MKPETIEKLADTLESMARVIPEEGNTEKVAEDQVSELDSSKVLDFLKFFGRK